MKGLSLWQPWASLIFTGAKRFETRSWATRYRGPIVIYAAKGGLPKYKLKDYLFGPLFKEDFQRGLAPLHGDTLIPKALIGIDDLPFGAALGVVQLVDCVRTDTMSLSQIGGDYPFGDFSPGRFAWQLEKVRAFEKPVPAKGAQGLFDVNLNNFRLAEAVRHDTCQVCEPGE